MSKLYLLIYCLFTLMIASSLGSSLNIAATGLGAEYVTRIQMPREDHEEIIPFCTPGPLGIRTLRRTNLRDFNGITIRYLNAGTPLTFHRSQLGAVPGGTGVMFYEVTHLGTRGFVPASDIGWVDCW